MSNKYHLAQLNIAHSKDDENSELMRSFYEQIDGINLIAEASPGFVWRYDPPNDANVSERIFHDPLMIVNMSVWESMDALRQFVYQSSHKLLIKNKSEWFTKMPETHQVLWWIKAGEIPSIESAKGKLDHIRANGPSGEAFNFVNSFKAGS